MIKSVGAANGSTDAARSSTRSVRLYIEPFLALEFAKYSLDAYRCGPTLFPYSFVVVVVDRWRTLDRNCR